LCLRPAKQSDEVADVAILQHPALSKLAEQGKIVPASFTNLARSSVAAGVRVRSKTGLVVS
jgi:hypothetical protein